MFLFTGGRGADEDLSDKRTRNVAHTALNEGATADDDRGPCVARPALCASSSSSHMLAVPSAPARSTHGPALKIPPVRLTLAGPMDWSHGIELGSRARLGTRPSGTWVVYIRTPWPLPSRSGPQGAAFLESSSESEQ